MSTNETISPRVIPEPVCSSDSVWYKEDMNTSITTVLDNKAALTHEHTGYAASEHTHSGYATAEHTHTGFAAEDHTHTEYASVTHDHDADYVAKSLQITDDEGGATIQLPAGSTENLLTKIESLPIGVHTFYSGSGNTGNPKTVEGWRGIIFKTSATQGFVQAYGSVGSVYTNYQDGTNGWRGWKAIFDCAPAPLWTGAIYPIASHTITPSKPLSQCTHGWLLLWSDYDPGTGEQNYDFVTTMIPKRAYTGQVWNGEKFICDVAHFVAEDPANDGRVLKYIQVYDDKIVGHSANSASPRNDVVLRAVYEF